MSVRFELYNIQQLFNIYRVHAPALSFTPNLVHRHNYSKTEVLDAWRKRDTKRLSEILQQVREEKATEESKKIALGAFYELSSHIGFPETGNLEDAVVRHIASKIKEHCQQENCINGLKELLKQIKEIEIEKDDLEWITNVVGVPPYKIIRERREVEERIKRRFLGLKKERERIEKIYVTCVTDYNYKMLSPDAVTSPETKKAFEVLISLGVLAKIDGKDRYIIPVDECEVEGNELVAIRDPCNYEIRSAKDLKKLTPLQKAINLLYEELIMPDYREHQQP